MFLNWDGFVSQLMQIFGDLEVVMTVKWKLSEFTQKGSAMDYTMLFQTYLTQVKWNQKAFMERYKQRLKSRVQDTLIYIKNATTMRELID